MRVKIVKPKAALVEVKKLKVCAYARVSTDSLKQEDSLENQVSTYERLITSNPDYVFAGVFADLRHIRLLREPPSISGND